MVKARRNRQPVAGGSCGDRADGECRNDDGGRKQGRWTHRCYLFYVLSAWPTRLPCPARATPAPWGGGFCGGQVFKFSGFASEEGSLGGVQPADAHVAIVTYWHSYEEHERSHADKIFKDKFSALAAMCRDSQELGYDMLWQGAPDRP